jgi:hypothetical protein
MNSQKTERTLYLSYDVSVYDFRKGNVLSQMQWNGLALKKRPKTL